MPSRWSWSGTRSFSADRPAGRLAALALAGLGSLGSLAALPAAPVAAATVLERAVTVDIQPDGGVAEHTRLAVRLDAPGDLSAWSPYSIYLDENRTLVGLEASARRPDGIVIRVGRKGLDTAEVNPPDVLHSSVKLRTVEIPAVPLGSVFTIDYRTAVKPYFPAGAISLAPGRDRVERLRVEVRGGGAGWRWRLAGPRDGLTVEETAGGVVVTAAGLAPDEAPEHAPEAAGAVLRYAWGPQASWDAVGRWYAGLLAGVPRGSEAVRQRARELIAGVAGRRERIERLAAFTRREVRYVAVEVGVGGYRPAPAQEVLTRRWGDCKDKALLLVDLLAAAGVEAFPALIRSGDEARVDREFPAPGEFNHVIVAIPVDGLELAADDPVAGGFLFVDATQTSGSLAWLHPAVQDQEALVVRGERSLLVHTPLLPGREEQALSVSLAATPEGDAKGQVRLELTGRRAAAWADRLAVQPAEAEGAVRGLLAAALPGASLLDPRFASSREGIPRFEVSARLEMPGLLPGSGPARAFQPATLAGLPAPGLLDGRAVPVVLAPGIARTTWRIHLPAGWCPPGPQDVKVANDLGSFRQTVAERDGVLTVERRTEVDQRWVEPARFSQLKELALAEHRAQKRQVRLECAPPKAARRISWSQDISGSWTPPIKRRQRPVIEFFHSFRRVAREDSLVSAPASRPRSSRRQGADLRSVAARALRGAGRAQSAGAPAGDRGAAALHGAGGEPRAGGAQGVRRGAPGAERPVGHAAVRHADQPRARRPDAHRQGARSSPAPATIPTTRTSRRPSGIPRR